MAYVADPVVIDTTPDTLRGAMERLNANLSDIEDEFNAQYDHVDVTIDGGGEAINPTTATKPWWLATYSGTIEEVFLLANSDESGSIQIDIWKQEYASYPPTNSESICGGNEPAIVSGIKFHDDVLTDWEVDFAAGDVFMFNVDSCTTTRRVTLTLKMRKTS